ncbi:S66 peptidase family protein [Pseudobacteriovorax antillogorgiicola]|uniref:Muramoyltetrapeptide carboxypeptidase n=1 Tax=Pseudobacteriovorax antillogorgiicola TaxID=1513793 RepID=A0A1Y6B836_9BACT|nr:LD-carboxypeptidase [Pseudobacteriovorax antillogorgiicola]TCS59240.1 muramoyltetrapeptide carboxypeptidase [Pseudobacteriovorax antillogorgiicola]SME90251.1 muramoyltetrapeptide carboxypeptidase [Pseudobacteriovorax antillogorgiicola]
MDQLQIKLIYPASKAPDDTPKDSILELKKAGFKIDEAPLGEPGKWNFHAARFQDRLSILSDALLATDINVILAARGGYGMSDLLPDLPWDKLQSSSRKMIVGYSDLTALQSACYTKLGWQSLHGPMPMTSYWGQLSDSDIDALWKALIHTERENKIALDASWGGKPHMEGILFGGCLSVLSNLIGTPYLPKQLDGHILFFEDVNEHPGKLFRYLNQWYQSGLFAGVEHLILGDFCGLGDMGYDKHEFCADVHERYGLSVSSSSAFGHCTPNYPVGIGSHGCIDDLTLSWQWRT